MSIPIIVWCRGILQFLSIYRSVPLGLVTLLREYAYSADLPWLPKFKKKELKEFFFIFPNKCLLGVTIASKNDYCDSIDIAGSTVAILLLLWTTIAILL